MEALKGYTDFEQSKILKDILPIESADGAITENYHCVPCWSLVALLDVLPFPNLSKDNLGSGKVGWMVSVFPDNCRYDSCWHDNPIDTCYEMIVKLHEQKLL